MRETVKKQREYFLTGETLDINFRAVQLKRLRQGLVQYEQKLLDALKKDLGKAAFEGYATELWLLHEEIKFTLKHIKAWTKPQRVKTPVYHFPASSRIYPEPLGVVLIMSPWNYPLQLTIAPLIAAIAAGNCAVVKPSRYSSNTSAAVEEMLKSCFPPEYVSVFQGGSEVNTRLLELKFDHIFFTGSPSVGKVVMEAAAKHLTPVTLELGGKSPCIVDKTAKLDIAARRIAWGKCVNSGQTCVAPDYLLVHSSIKDRLIGEIGKCVREFYGGDVLRNDDYPRIINEKHFNRLCSLMEKEHIAIGGKVNREKMKIEPTVLDGITLDSPVMKEEIFGPLLPVIEFTDIEQAAGIIRKLGKPLALYTFTSDRALEQYVLKQLSFGGGCVNDTLVHLATPHMHFGGVGESGMGGYHGKKGFDTFSHYKSVMKRSALIDFSFKYAPYGDKLRILKRL